MKQAFSTFAMAGWAGYHGTTAAAVAASLAGAAVPGPVAQILSNAPLAATLVLAHGLLAGVCFALIVALRCGRDRNRTEAHALVTVLAGVGLVVTAVLAGSAGAAPGTYAVFMAATVAGFAFDRALAGGEEEEEEVDHAAFMREAARLGASMSPRQDRDGR